ncbi:50S ribosomal protein L10 [Acidaminococcus fermentans]|uniref:Large ribosomal subunit protein uL10 n=3 Tax=Acidaminococcus fermentans TaxID=905 RepID=D2RNP2_ACIFV|nr:50S ribosomal protein L10 [Acidaminococcus fermentans]ADB46668.1 ribosomal protein L10 [Acidaminococcus fermentans DSM 20731]MCF0140217.1 50S ribosomal protein L10 [Acidaminococcus fermentans]MCI6286806.1 50S ribosomal protein L10 [Acidaminococcus fermentans]MCI7194089.1 50S ribosomal protein L10 [Acidaminococcus fermentans]MDD6287046.1 50S ribosomal protein L10 [Acidaminococcus fermentans]
MHDIRPEKAGKVAELKDLLSSSKGAVLVDYCGLTVAEDTELRSKMREAGVKYMVAKNTFIRIAAKEAGIEGLDAYLEHNTAVAFSAEDPVAPAKILNDFSKDHKALEIKAGILDGKVIALDEVKALAELPSREELLAKLVGSMQAPISGLVNVLQGTIRNFVYTLEAVRQKKEQESA